jgi:hypothetical protein
MTIDTLLLQYVVFEFVVRHLSETRKERMNESISDSLDETASPGNEWHFFLLVETSHSIAALR